MERPILFSAPMVQALLAGRKTQTRRIAKMTSAGHLKESRGHRRWHPEDPEGTAACPYGQPGDHLWVRETFGYDERGHTIYRSDDIEALARERQWVSWPAWRPSIHMPRWASRITLEITDVRVERLQHISEQDAIAEGATQFRLPLHPALEDRRHVVGFQTLWESINGPGSWEANPWVWVLSFRRVEA